MLSITKENYNIYKRVYEIIWIYQAKSARVDPNSNLSPIKVLEEWEGKSMSLARKGLKAGLSDTVSQMVSLPIEYRNPLDALLLGEGQPSLNKLISLVNNVSDKVLKKGKIRNENEYYIIKEIVNDWGYEITDDD
jgi:hypothetical protein